MSYQFSMNKIQHFLNNLYFHLIKSLYDNIKLNEHFFIFLKQCKHYDGIHFIFLERVVLNDDECQTIFVGISKMNLSRKMQELVKCKFYHYLDYTS